MGRWVAELLRARSRARRVQIGPWAVVVASAMMLVFGAGLSFYGFPVYLDELVRHGDVSIQAASSAVSIFYLTFALAGLPVTAWLRRVDARRVILVGSLIAGAGLGSVAIAKEAWHFALAFGLVGVGVSASTVIPCTAVVVELFSEQRARALAVTMTGFSVGGIGVAPVIGLVVHREGLSTSAPWLGLAYAILVGGLGAVCVSSRRHLPRSSRAKHTTTDVHSRVEQPDVVSHPRPHRPIKWLTFSVVAGTSGVLMGNQMGPQVHLVRLGTERGMERPFLLLTVLALSSLTGRLVGGLFMGRVPTVDFLVGLSILQAVALVLLGLPAGKFGVAAGASIFGICIGNLGVVMPLLLVEQYGLADFSRLFGIHQLAANLGMAAGPGLVGWMRREAGAYQMPMVLLAVASLGCAALIHITFRPPRRSHVAGTRREP